MEAKINAGNTKHAQATLNCILKGESETTGVHHYNVLGKKKKRRTKIPHIYYLVAFKLLSLKALCIYIHQECVIN